MLKKKYLWNLPEEKRSYDSECTPEHGMKVRVEDSPCKHRQESSGPRWQGDPEEEQETAHPHICDFPRLYIG